MWYLVWVIMFSSTRTYQSSTITSGQTGPFTSREACVAASYELGYRTTTELPTETLITTSCLSSELLGKDKGKYGLEPLSLGGKK